MKNKMRIIVPAVLVLIGILGYSIAATNLQTWQTQSGSRVASVNTDGALNCNNALAIATTASVTGSSGTATITSSPSVISSTGSISLSAVAEGTQYKQYVIGVSALTTTAATTWTYPVPFTLPPRLNGNNTSSGTVGMSTGALGTITNSTTGGSLAASGTTATGIIVIDGQ